MKTISLWQPWASILASGAKQVETRGWFMHHRGPLLIHAAKRWNAELRDLCAAEPFASTLHELHIDLPGMGPNGLPLGAIVGRVDVVACFRTEAAVVSDKAASGCYGYQGAGVKEQLFITEKERAFGDYSPGRYAMLCVRPVLFAKPIPFRGMQGLFEVSDDLVRGAELVKG